MNEYFAKALKQEHNAWLVVCFPTYEDNGATLDNYLIFKDDVVLETYFPKEYGNIHTKNDLTQGLRKCTIYLWYAELQNLLSKLDDERKIKLEEILNEHKAKYEATEKHMPERAKRNMIIALKGKAVEFYMNFRDDVEKDTSMCIKCLKQMREDGFDLNELKEVQLTTFEEKFIENILKTG